MQDCQWLQYLHSVGLLNASFRPPADICAVRSLMRPLIETVDLGWDSPDVHPPDKRPVGAQLGETATR